MNIAFPALIIAILILPGAIFRYAYARGSWGWSSPISFRSVSDELAYSAVFAIGLHFVWLAAVSAGGYRADFPSLLALVAGSYGPQGERYEAALASVAGHPVAIATYLLTLYLFSGNLGRLSHYGVRRSRLDLRTQVFRFRNEWHYLLTGEILSFHEVSIEPREIGGVFLSAIVDHGKDSYLYRGIVEDWSFDGSGNLDSIRLRFAHRRLLSEDRDSQAAVGSGDYIPPDGRYYEIHGDLFLLRYSQLRTMNLDYFSLSEEKVGTPEPAGAPSALRELPEVDGGRDQGK